MVWSKPSQPETQNMRFFKCKSDRRSPCASGGEETEKRKETTDLHPCAGLALLGCSSLCTPSADTTGS